MPPKTKRLPENDDTESPHKLAHSAAEAGAVAAHDDDMGEFEDAFSDEEDDEAERLQQQVSAMEVEDGDDDDDEGDDEDAIQQEEEEEEDEEAAEKNAQVYLPGEKLGEDEVLEHDASAYEMLHTLNMEWPCLSFDILRDSLGNERTSFPMTMYVTAGTQADASQNNKLLVMKLSQLCRTKYDNDIDGEMAEDDDDTDDNAVVESRSVKHSGGVNRVRAMPNVESHIVATWADTSRVHIWDMTEHVRALDTVGGSLNKDLPTSPMYTFAGHPTEGFALDWSPIQAGRLLSGDCRKNIYLTQINDGGKWTTDTKPFSGHTDSVEDIQWSPVEANVFASASVDQTVRIWDLRNKNGSAVSVKAHAADVNVIAWNRTVTYLMASGGDDGVFSVWDLRNLKSNAPAATFKWHKGPITSLQWHPKEESVLAVSGADDQVSIWDFSLEADEETIAQGVDVPPQLLFIHQGQTEIKEVHWHAQAPGVLLSTAATGFNIFKTISV